MCHSPSGHEERNDLVPKREQQRKDRTPKAKEKQNKLQKHQPTIVGTLTDQEGQFSISLALDWCTRSCEHW